MTKALALEWAKHNIQVNALCPGYVATALTDEVFKDENHFNHVTKKIPARRLGEIDEMVGGRPLYGFSRRQLYDRTKSGY